MEKHLSIWKCVLVFTWSEIYYKHSRPHPVLIYLYVVSSTNTQYLGQHNPVCASASVCICARVCIVSCRGPPGHRVWSNDWSTLIDHASLLLSCIFLSSLLHFCFSLNVILRWFSFSHLLYLSQIFITMIICLSCFSASSWAPLRIRESLRMSGQYISVLNTQLCQ